MKNLDYAESLDDFDDLENNLDNSENVDASKNLDSLEGCQNSEINIDDAGMDSNTASFNTEVKGPEQNTTNTTIIDGQPESNNHDGKEPNILDLETTMNNKYGVRSGHYNL